jgi:hypothetical protein
VLFYFPQTVTLTKPNTSLVYFISVFDNGNGKANAVLVTSPGSFNYSKNGCYVNNKRVLNWVSKGELSALPSQPVYSRTTKGVDKIKLDVGWYYAELKSGMGGGNGANGTFNSSSTAGIGGAGGTPNIQKEEKKIFFIGYSQEIKIKVGGSGNVGGDGGNGGKDDSTTSGAGGGGGGGGGGEETFIEGIAYTGFVPNGMGGNGGQLSTTATGGLGSLAGGGGSGGGLKGRDGSRNGGDGITDANFSLTAFGGSYGSSPNGTNGARSRIGGGGGACGLNGTDQPDGAPGGSCLIFALG